jgi:nitrite reductase/ring-hydroxylating ferredoxin subunit
VRRKPVIAAVLLTIVLGLLAATACSSQASSAGSGNNDNNFIKQTQIKAQLNGDTVTVPIDDLDRYGNVNFAVNTATDNYMFMAYKSGGKLYVRADDCVPCGSQSFTFKKGTLVCDACGTVFDAQTGKGIKGVKACQGYPKQSVSYQVADGNIVMNGSDLVTSFQNTINPKKY